MRILSTLVLISIIAIPTYAPAMTRDQAREQCRAEIPRVKSADKGHSRGYSNPNKDRMRECVRAKLGRSPAG